MVSTISYVFEKIINFVGNGALHRERSVPNNQDLIICITVL